MAVERRQSECHRDRFERRVLAELAAIRSQLNNQAVAAASPRFSHFSRLPAELRHMIWELAIPRRLYTHGGMANTACDGYSFPPPTILRVCREARQVALRKGHFRPSGQYTGGRQKPAVWFSPETDVVHLDRVDLDVGEQARNEFLEVDVNLCELEEEEACHDMLRPRILLGTVSSYARDQTIYVGSVARVDSSWDPTLVGELFGTDSVLCLGVEDQERIKKIMAAENSSEVGILDDSTLFWLESMSSCRNENMRETIRLLTRQMVQGCMDERQGHGHSVLGYDLLGKSPPHYDELFHKDGSPNTSIPWVGDLLRRVKLVPAVFLRLEADKPGYDHVWPDRNRDHLLTFGNF